MYQPTCKRSQAQKTLPKAIAHGLNSSLANQDEALIINGGKN
jgi:hypothetical protein